MSRRVRRNTNSRSTRGRIDLDDPPLLEEGAIMDMLGLSDGDQDGKLPSSSIEIAPPRRAALPLNDRIDAGDENQVPAVCSAVAISSAGTNSDHQSDECNQKAPAMEQRTSLSGVPGAHAIAGVEAHSGEEDSTHDEAQRKAEAVNNLDHEIVIAYLIKMGLHSAAEEVEKQLGVFEGSQASAERARVVASMACVIETGSNGSVSTFTRPLAHGCSRNTNRERISRTRSNLSSDGSITESEEDRVLERSDIRRSLPVNIVRRRGSFLGEGNNREQCLNLESSEEDAEATPPRLSAMITIGSIEDPVTATAVDDVMTVQATSVDSEEVEKAKRNFWKRALLVIGLAIVAILIIVLSSILGPERSRQNEFDASAAPTLSPTYSIESREAILLEILGPIAGYDALSKNGTAHFETFRWMTQQDEGANLTRNPDLLFQRYFMALLFQQTHGFNWTDSFRFLSPLNECEWTNVAEACDEDGYLIALELYDNNLFGQLPAEIVHLSHLQRMNFDMNNLTGTLPNNISMLSNLQTITFEKNRLSGTLPEELFEVTTITTINFLENFLQGTISSAIGNLKGLTHLYLGGNDFEGSVPFELYNLPALQLIDIRQNRLNGKIPEIVGEMTTLVDVAFYGNFLTGTLPTEFGSLSRLTNLQLSDLELTGTIPSELGELTMVSRLALSYNFFVGTLPASFLQLSSLMKLYLQQNKLTGDLTFICNSGIGPLDPFRADILEVTCPCCQCCSE